MERGSRRVNQTTKRMKELGIDIETYSSNDLTECGVYKYVEAEDFTILLFGYSVDGGPAKCVDFASGETLPPDIKAALTDPEVIKTAFNAAFERICIGVYLGIKGRLDPRQWRCTMVRAARMGLPLSLAQCGEVLKLEDRKMTEGKALIRYFSVPNKQTKQGITKMIRHKPSDAPEKWATFKAYNIRDVDVEQAILKKVRRLEAPEFDEDLYVADQHINDRGVMIDQVLVNNAARFDELYKDELFAEARKLTGMSNPNSPGQIKQYISENTGFTIDSLNKKNLDDYEVQFKYWPKVQKVLALRREMGKTSNKKYTTMQKCVCKDSRVHGLLQFCGAARTGRRAGRLVQLQNLPQNHIEDLKDARELVKYGDYNAFETLYDVPDTLSQLIRTAFVPRKGMKFIVADFSAIEARVLSFLANEKWRMDVFANNGDIYCQSASAMFKVPVEKHGVNGHLRQKGKIAELACGYGGSVGALKAMGAIDMGLQEEELEPLVKSWREANPHIVEMWWAVDKAIKTAVRNRTKTETHGLKFIYKSGMLFIELPSGRRLAYVKPKIEINQYGSESVTYEGVGATKKWERLESYGPKFVENIIQAISRDILCYAMQRLSYCFIVGHVHDEMIIECSKEMSLEKVCEQMGETPPWIKGLLLRADGYECEFYKKD